LPPPHLIALSQLLPVWLTAGHPWKSSTLVGYRSVVRSLLADPLAASRVATLTSQQVRAAIGRWQTAGASLSVVGGRFRVLRTALAWAYDERLLDTHPLRLMRGPGRPDPRRPLTDNEIGALLATAELSHLEMHANHVGDHPSLHRLHRAEQDLLLIRLAADTGARRGELAALRLDDLNRRVLQIERAISAGQLTTPKSGQVRTLTVGTTTAELWHRLATTWQHRADQCGRRLGPWVFAADLAHQQRVGSEVLGRRFAVLRDTAGVPAATLHRLRHSVATYLVARGQVLQAQARLGHADADTTLREYAHAVPLTDSTVADALDHHLTASTGAVFAVTDLTRRAQTTDSGKPSPGGGQSMCAHLQSRGVRRTSGPGSADESGRPRRPSRRSRRSRYKAGHTATAESQLGSQTTSSEPRRGCRAR
jgi:integrase